MKEKIKTKIILHKEPKELNGSLGVYENCVFCNKPTDTWHLDTNQPVCRDCANIHDVKEIHELIKQT